MVQLIETSLISGHFANLNNAAYIDIFSCNPYDPEEAARFTQAFFEAKSCQMHVIERT
jgi:S-adenosylmethionine/arginine decarboxylase-like enzyme